MLNTTGKCTKNVLEFILKLDAKTNKMYIIPNHRNGLI